MRALRKRVPQITSILGIVFFILSVCFAAMMAFPFQPYQQLSFTELPEEVCTKAAVPVLAERTIESPPLGSVDRAKVVSTWIDSSDGTQIAAGEATIPVEEVNREQEQSPIIREAPGKPGEYFLYAETTVYGYLGVVPRHTTVATTSDYPVEVVDCEGES